MSTTTKSMTPMQVTASAVAVVAAAAASSLYYYYYHVCKRRSGNVSIPRELLQSPYAQEIKLAVRLAKQSGDNMKGYMNAKGTVHEAQYKDTVENMETKSCDIDYCTQMDLKNEHDIMQGIRSTFPTHAIISEESVESNTANNNSNNSSNNNNNAIPPLHRHVPTWIIDPIDGTTNFARGLSQTCVSIGYCVDGKPVMGVIYAPATNEWYMAVRDCGAFRNGVEIVPKQENHANVTTKSLAQSVVCCEFGYCRQPEEIKAMLDVVSNIMAQKCVGIRQFASTCLDMCYVATGQVDVFYVGIVTEGGKPWDFCAATVICQQAGCIVEAIPQTDPELDFNLYGRSVICAVSRELADETRAVILGK